MDLISTLHIRTPRLILVNVTSDIVTKILEGDRSLADYLGIHVPSPWSEFGPGPFEFMQQQLLHDPESVSWWSWLPVLLEDNALAGNAGYKGPPKDGMVEIGYEVAPVYQRRGLATEMARALMERAFTFPEVQQVIAHTLPEENFSVRVLKKCGFHFKEVVEDPEDGTIWKWNYPRPV